MSDPRESWLISTAQHCRRDFPLFRPFDVEGLAKELGIPVVERSNVNLKVSRGYVEKDSESELYIAVERTNGNQPRLSGRERFILAHEIGHVLLIRNFDWNPSSGEEYRHCERLCHKFAAALLIPNEAFSKFAIDSPSRLLGLVDSLSRTFRVSRQAVACRFAELFDGHLFLLGRECLNYKDQRVFEVTWCEGSSTIPKPFRSTHLEESDALGSSLLSVWAQCKVLAEPLKHVDFRTNIGPGAARSSQDGGIFAAILNRSHQTKLVAK